MLDGARVVCVCVWVCWGGVGVGGGRVVRSGALRDIFGRATTPP